MFLEVVCLGLMLSCALPFIYSFLQMGVLLLVVSLFVATMSGVGVGCWYGLIMFLIYVSGLLVLFGYMLATTPNVSIPPSGWAVVSVLVGSLLVSDSIVFPVNAGSDSWRRDVVSLYSGDSLELFVAFVVLLLVILLVVVNLCFKSAKPLRSFF